MNTKAYPREKREIIAKRPFDQLLAFSKDVSPQLLDAIMRRLPPVQGFREGTKELNMRLHRYLRRVELWNDSDWSMFNDLWMDWIKTHPKLDEVLTKFDNTGDFQVKHPVTPPNSELDIKCFEYLATKSTEVSIPRELIKQFYDFGYFIVDPSIEHYIEMSKSTAELELFELPAKIKKIEENCKTLEILLGTIQRRSEVAEYTNEKKINFVERIDAIEARLMATQTHSNTLAEANINLGEKIAQVQQNLAQFNSHYDQLEKRLSKDLQESCETRCLRLEKDFEQIGTAQEQFDSELKALSYKLVPIENSLIQKKGVGASDTDYRGDLGNKRERSVPIEVEYLQVDDCFQRLDTPDKFMSTLVDSLRSIGMQSVAAQVLTHETFAALAAGQLVSFAGSIAPIVAFACARSLAGPNVCRIRIPIGLIDSTEFDQLFLEVLETSEGKDLLSALIIEGMNLSAPEAYAPRLRQLIAERFFGLNSMGKNLILLATLVDGPSALDIPQELCELGPVFHTDCFEWRDKWSPRVVGLGSITSDVWKEWRENFGEPPEEWEDIFADFISVAGPPTVLWRRALYLAAAAINRGDTASQFPSLTQSLIFGWLLPHGLATGVDFTNFDQLLAEGQMDAQKKDDRLVQFLRLNTRTLREL